MADRPDQDHRVVEAVLGGSREAFGDLVARYQNLVAGVAWRYGAPRGEIEDVVSEVFIKVYRNLHQYRPEHAFSTWLYRLAVNHVLDRGRRARKELGRTELPEQLADDAPRADDRVEETERATLLREALDELDPRYKEVIFVVYVEGKKIEEAARILAIPTGTAKTRLMRGRQALKKILMRRHPEYFGD
ncbi:MAG: sigma-70 family RNA polymerase sigma factor [Acidobacteriota bacterium]|nr:sigma-70 family RNA polymerase sigma factor [Acidobacteriota bacterium]